MKPSLHRVASRFIEATDLKKILGALFAPVRRSVKDYDRFIEDMARWIKSDPYDFLTDSTSYTIEGGSPKSEKTFFFEWSGNPSPRGEPWLEEDNSAEVLESWIDGLLVGVDLEDWAEGVGIKMRSHIKATRDFSQAMRQLVRDPTSRKLVAKILTDAVQGMLRAKSGDLSDIEYDDPARLLNESGEDSLPPGAWLKADFRLELAGKAQGRAQGGKVNVRVPVRIFADNVDMAS